MSDIHLNRFRNLTELSPTARIELDSSSNSLQVQQSGVGASLGRFFTSHKTLLKRNENAALAFYQALQKEYGASIAAQAVGHFKGISIRNGQVSADGAYFVTAEAVKTALQVAGALKEQTTPTVFRTPEGKTGVAVPSSPGYLTADERAQAIAAGNEKRANQQKIQKGELLIDFSEPSEATSALHQAVIADGAGAGHTSREGLAKDQSALLFDLNKRLVRAQVDGPPHTPQAIQELTRAKVQALGAQSEFLSEQLEDIKWQLANAQSGVSRKWVPRVHPDTKEPVKDIDGNPIEDLKQRRLRPEEKTERIKNLREKTKELEEALAFVLKELNTVNSHKTGATDDDVIYSTIRVENKVK
jgi:hypothetical protein